MSDAQKNIYVVLGMARSGTSVITKGLSALGVELGNKLYPANESNPKGFQEDTEIVYNINRSLLFFLNYPWFVKNHVHDYLLENSAVLQHFRNEAAKILENRFAMTRDWGFKDPRTVTLLSFWKDVFREMNLQEKYIIALRNPLASAHSNKKMNQSDVESALLAWLAHTISAIDGTKGAARVLVAYENVLENPRTQLLRIRNMLDIQLVSSPQKINEFSQDFIDKNLERQKFNDEDLQTHPALKTFPLVKEVYTLLHRVARDDMVFESEDFRNQWSVIKVEFEKLYPTYNYIFSLLNKNKLLERELRTISKSFPWKLLYPFRMMDDILRFYRKKSRAKRKLAKIYE